MLTFYASAEMARKTSRCHYALHANTLSASITALLLRLDSLDEIHWGEELLLATSY
jgi:hypothetical protein